MTDTLVATPDPEPTDVADDFAAWEAEMEEGGWAEDPFADDDWDDWVRPEPEPFKRALLFERFIVTKEPDHDDRSDDEDARLFAVRARMKSDLWGDDDTPHYNEPLLWGDEGWCKTAADALNEAMEP